MHYTTFTGESLSVKFSMGEVIIKEVKRNALELKVQVESMRILSYIISHKIHTEEAKKQLSEFSLTHCGSEALHSEKEKEKKKCAYTILHILFLEISIKVMFMSLGCCIWK